MLTVMSEGVLRGMVSSPELAVCLTVREGKEVASLPADATEHQ